MYCLIVIFLCLREFIKWLKRSELEFLKNYFEKNFINNFYNKKVISIVLLYVCIN